MAALAVVALAAAGCGSSSGGSSGGSSGVSPASYVKSICTAATAWKNAIQKAGTRLQVSPSKSLANTKTSYVTFIDALVNATATAEGQLSAAGSPSVSDGKKISGKLVQTFATAKSNLQRAAADAATIPTTSTRSFDTAASKVEGEVRSSLSGMANATPQKNPQLHAAAAKDSTCRSLSSSS